MNFLLEFSKDQFAQKNIPFSDVLSSGGMVVLTGMLAVFGVLCAFFIILLIEIPPAGFFTILSVDSINADGAPVFKSNVKAGMPTWLPSSGLGQCWYFQVGIKYMFN